MATFYPIGGPPDNLSKSAHPLHLKLASMPVLRNMIAWRSLSRHSMISNFQFAMNGMESKLSSQRRTLSLPPTFPSKTTHRCMDAGKARVNMKGSVL